MAAAVPGSGCAPAPSGLLVLASAQAWVPRPPPPPPHPPSSLSSSPSGREGQRLLRLQLSAAPGLERFRLGLRGGPDSGPEPSLVEYSLKEISYEMKTATCHELKVLARPDYPLVFHFEEEHEAQKWWTVLSSCLWEVQKATEGTSLLTGRPPSHCLAAANSLPEPKTFLPLELARKEDLALHLSAVIELGDEEAAMQCATVLAQQHATLRILLKESCYPRSEISMKVQVEDATCSTSITTRVHTYTTIAALRQKVFQDYGFHPSVQRWIIGQCLCMEDRTIGSYGIRKDGDTAFLYLLSAKGANLSLQCYKEDKDWVLLQPPPADTTDAKHKYGTMPSPLPKKAPVAAGGKEGRLQVPQKEISGAKDAGRKRDVGEISHFLGNLQLRNFLPGPSQAPPDKAAAPPSSPVPDGWSCPSCTFINKPTRPGCEMCSRDRPANYVVPGGYRPDEMELWRMKQEKEGILQYQKEKGRREDGSAVPCAHSLGSSEDFIHLSSEFS